MKRSITFGYAKQIALEDIELSISQDGGVNSNLRVELSEYKFPENAVIFLRFINSITLERIRIGTVDEVNNSEIKVILMGWSDASSVDLIVVETLGSNKGRLLGIAEGVIKKEGNVDTEGGLLKTVQESIYPQLYVLNFEDDIVTLILDRSVDIQKVLRSKSFRALHSPGIFKQILMHILFVEQQSIHIEGSDDWRDQWLSFAKSIHHDNHVEVYNAESPEIDLYLRWIDDCVGEFIKKKFYEIEYSKLLGV